MKAIIRSGAITLGTVLGLSLLPIASPAHAKPSQHPYTLGPTSLGHLKIGMTKRKALATGMIDNPEKINGCGWYRLAPRYGQQNPGNAVIISPRKGVVSLSGTTRAHTPEGITMGSVSDHHGSTLRQLKNAYPKLRPAGDIGFVFTTPVPSHPNLRYRFAVNTSGDNRVKDMDVEAVHDGGCGLNG